MAATPIVFSYPQIDAASGGFIAPFSQQELLREFRIERRLRSTRPATSRPADGAGVHPADVKIRAAKICGTP